MIVFRLLFACLAVAALAVVLPPNPASAQTIPAPCSVLENKPCTPYSCGVYDGPNCVPDIQYGLGEDLRLTLGTAAVGNAKRPDGDLNTLRDLFAALRACWKPPAAENAHRGMQMTMRFAFNRAGKLMGTPQVTYATPEVPKPTRDLYREALAQSLQDCTPLTLSKGLGGAIAGRPIAIRVIDDRKDRSKDI
jgi:hypothetical protein